MRSRSDARREQPTSDLRRIFVDCTLIDFAKQPTGIPRVVRKYLEEAWIWSKPRNIEVVPVLPTDRGLVLVSHMPAWMPKEGAATVAKYSNSTVPETADSFQPKIRFSAERALRHLKSLTGSAPANRAPARLVDETGIKVGVGDVLFCPAYWHDVDPRLYRELKEKGVFIVTLVHDVLPILFANCYHSPWRDMFKTNVIAAFTYADLMFTVSKYTAEAVSELAARSGLGPPPIVVAYNGFEPLTRNDHALQKNYFGNTRYRRVHAAGVSPYIMVGSIEPKKSHIPVIQCFEAMWKAGFQRRLFIIGRRGWMDEPVIERIQRSAFFNKNLFWFDDLDDYELAHAYDNSRGLVVRLDWRRLWNPNDRGCLLQQAGDCLRYRYCEGDYGFTRPLLF